MLTVQSMREAR